MQEYVLKREFSEGAVGLTTTTFPASRLQVGPPPPLLPQGRGLYIRACAVVCRSVWCDLALLSAVHFWNST